VKLQCHQEKRRLPKHAKTDPSVPQTSMLSIDGKIASSRPYNAAFTTSVRTPLTYTQGTSNPFLVLLRHERLFIIVQC